MKNLIDAVKAIIFIIVSFATIAAFVNGITGWREKKELKKLYIITSVIWFAFIGFMHLISYL
ncbi:hypothetical protein [Phosphitispora sp. TUW77]|uniref:hypothetical protein n=1 Tax=Phosphitispora sp. TUW77 TaxID=3152361 RepID=UPI003AB58660